MIGKLTGTLDSISGDAALIDVGGVGYVVHAASRTLSKLGPNGAPVSLLIETHVREDAINLYGFWDATERDWFRLLTTVQGVGAKVALAILSVLAPDDLSLAIAAQDKAIVTRAPGVGPKLAQRIVSELKDKAGNIALGAGPIAEAFVVAFRFPNLFRRLVAEGAFLFGVRADVRQEARKGRQAGSAGFRRQYALVAAADPHPVHDRGRDLHGSGRDRDGAGLPRPAPIVRRRRAVHPAHAALPRRDDDRGPHERRAQRELQVRDGRGGADPAQRNHDPRPRLRRALVQERGPHAGLGGGDRRHRAVSLARLCLLESGPAHRAAGAAFHGRDQAPLEADGAGHHRRRHDADQPAGRHDHRELHHGRGLDPLFRRPHLSIPARHDRHRDRHRAAARALAQDPHRAGGGDGGAEPRDRAFDAADPAGRDGAGGGGRIDLHRDVPIRPLHAGGRAQHGGGARRVLGGPAGLCADPRVRARVLRARGHALAGDLFGGLDGDQHRAFRAAGV
ncbi:MAG: Holliday junction branch migration protein RuvA, partial [Rhodospirillales bacterium]|nr:Holliday junction branch migration protein RuvA [Rhodospirillales bacterium]